MQRAANEVQLNDSNARLEAEGYQWRDAAHGERRTLVTSPDAHAPGGFIFVRNGGMERLRHLTLYEGDRLIRFSVHRRRGVALRDEDHLNSPWWLTEDRFYLLLDRARTAGVGLVEMARRQLALPADWTDADVLVAARPQPGILLAAYAGPGRTAEAGKERRIIARDYDPHFAAVHFIEQIYIPGLGRHAWRHAPPPNAATLWLRFERLYDPNARGFDP